MGWTLSPALQVLRNEVNSKYPNRDKRTDGTISGYPGARSSHNVNSEGIVNAFDVTVGDYPGGITPEQAAIDVEIIRESIKNDPRGYTAYIIYQQQIADGVTGEWRPYYGEYHGNHYHVSTDADILTGEAPSGLADYNLTIPWGLLEEEMPLTNDDIERILKYPIPKLGKDVNGNEGGTTSLWNEAAYGNSNNGWIVNEIRNLIDKIFFKKIKRRGGTQTGETTLNTILEFSDANFEKAQGPTVKK